MNSLVILKTEQGIALIAAIFFVVVFGFIGVAVVSLVNTQGFSAMNEVKSDQAFFIAEGGAELAQFGLAQNLDWYRSAVDPISIPATGLGAGNFNLSVNLPATMLRNVLSAAAAAMTVYTTDRFPASGFLQVEDDITATAEFVQYTGIAGNTFTGLTRGRTIGTVPSVASPHDRRDRVYPVTFLGAGGLGNSCSVPASFTITAHPKFLNAGTIDIEGEEISYSGATTVGGVTTLTGVLRCRNGTPSAAHLSGQPVTPLLVDGTVPNFEAEVLSNGTVGFASMGNAARVVRKTVQR